MSEETPSSEELAKLKAKGVDIEAFLRGWADAHRYEKPFDWNMAREKALKEIENGRG